MKRLTIRKYPKIFLLSKNGNEWVRHIAVPEDDWRDIMRVVNAARAWQNESADWGTVCENLSAAVTALEGKKK